MSTKHTPGPWTPFILDKPLSEIPTYVEKCIAAGTGEEFFFVAAEMPDGAVDVCHVGNGPRREANARLIAAAPELLAALKDVVGWVPGSSAFFTDGSSAAVERARAAIAKAEGRA